MKLASKVVLVIMMVVVAMVVSVAFAQQAPVETKPVIDTTTVVAIAGVAWSVLSEVLSLLPKIKANGVIQLVINLLGVIGGKKAQL